MRLPVRGKSPNFSSSNWLPSAGGLIQPAGKDGSLAQAARFLREDDENRLSYLLRLMWIAGLAECDGINHVDILRN